MERERESYLRCRVAGRLWSSIDRHCLSVSVVDKQFEVDAHLYHVCMRVS